MTTPPLVIVTPCSRPQNLEKMRESIRFEDIGIWLIIYDTRHIPFEKRYSDNSKILELECKDEGTAGHQIRNAALNIIQNGLIYFLDDDNIMHPFFWTLTSQFKAGNIYTFNLLYQTGAILRGDNPVPKKIDTSQYVFDRSLIGDLRFNIGDYCADGIFINTLYEQNRERSFHYNYIAAYYNWLNKEQPLPISIPSF
jgi:hypothetical protein